LSFDNYAPDSWYAYTIIEILVTIYEGTDFYYIKDITIIPYRESKVNNKKRFFKILLQKRGKPRRKQC